MSESTTIIGYEIGITRRAISISQETRSQHLYIVGKTGTGKSTLLRNLISADIEAGRGVGFLDPHGSEAEALLDCIPANRIRETIYYAPQEPSLCIPFNILANVPTERQHLVADAVVECLKNIWGDSWGPRMEYILYNAVASLLEVQTASLGDLKPLLTDEAFRQRVIAKLKNNDLRSFWTQEFGAWQPRFREEAISPILNKIGQLILSPAIQGSLGQKKRRIHMRHMMDSKQIFIANLSKGGLGVSKSGLLGSFLVSAFQDAAMSRPTSEQAERDNLPLPPPFTLYIDEFQSFQTDAFTSILSEARKYGLQLVLAHQFTSQLNTSVREAIFGNVGSIISFRIGHSDAEVLNSEFGEDFQPNKFSDLQNYHVIARINDASSIPIPVLGKTCPPHERFYGYSSSIRKLTQQRLVGSLDERPSS